FGAAPAAPPAPKAMRDLEKAEAQSRPREDRREYVDGVQKKLQGDMNLARGVASSATAGELGDFFQYVIDHPVSLPRQKSAMLPIVSTDVEGAKVSIYNERTLAKHPLFGLRLKNTSGVHLMQGPITVFDKNTYAGDSRI